MAARFLLLAGSHRQSHDLRTYNRQRH